MVTGDDNDEKIIRLALLDDSNDNAFQQNPGLGMGAIFGVNDSVTKAQIMAKMLSIFTKFEAQKRFRLRPDTVQWAAMPGSGELTLRFWYWNLETDDTRLFSQPYRISGATGT